MQFKDVKNIHSDMQPPLELKNVLLPGMLSRIHNLFPLGIVFIMIMIQACNQIKCNIKNVMFGINGIISGIIQLINSG